MSYCPYVPLMNNTYQSWVESQLCDICQDQPAKFVDDMVNIYCEDCAEISWEDAREGYVEQKRETYVGNK